MTTKATNPSPQICSAISFETTHSSIFDKLEDGTYKESLSISTPLTPLFSPVLPIEQSSQSFTFDHKSNDSLECQSQNEKLLNELHTGKLSTLFNREKLDSKLKQTVKGYNKALLRSKKFQSNKDDQKSIWNGEYVFMKLQLYEIELVKINMVYKLIDQHYTDILKNFELYNDCYTTNGEKKQLEAVLQGLFDQFYELYLKVEYLDREKFKLMNVVHNRGLQYKTKRGALKDFKHWLRNKSVNV